MDTKKEKVWKNIVITFSSDNDTENFWIVELTGDDGKKHYQVRSQVTSIAPSKGATRIHNRSDSRN